MCEQGGHLISELGAESFEHVVDGLLEPSEVGEVTNFAYDYRNRLTGVERRSSGGVLLSEFRFTYDVYDRLIVRSVNGGGVRHGLRW